jgi:GNAT superfamily N-acetyltransferase
MIRPCAHPDLNEIFLIINDAAQAYQGVIPGDCWHEPYMPMDELVSEVRDGVEFWGLEQAGKLAGVMGIQDRREVTLLRHAYVRTADRRSGLGTRLLHHLEQLTDKPILIGTWTAATWAIRFYQKNGYTPLSAVETVRLLRRYWSIPERQISTSIVLAKPALNLTAGALDNFPAKIAPPRHGSEKRHSDAAPAIQQPDRD